MGRESSPYIVGDWWLDKRRDGKAPDVWQIACYDHATRSICYRSTRRRELDGPNGAKAKIHAHVEMERAKGKQDNSEAKVIPLLFLYWEEHGKTVASPGQIASSIRCFIGFLMQDEAGLSVTVSGLNKALFERFRLWRMGPHEYHVPWYGKTYDRTGDGVKGESVSRNLDDIRAALGHNVGEERLAFAPTVPALAEEYRSPPKDVTFSMKELGAIVAFTRGDIETHQYALLQLGTAVRPEAAAAFDPAFQWNADMRLIDLHPKGWRRTKKRNPIVPAIAPLAAVVDAWAERGARPVKSRKRAFHTIRRALGLAANTEWKTIRHTVATRIRAMGVPGEEVETLLGHRVLKKTTEVYAKYDPQYLARAARALAKLWTQVMEEADKWDAGHLRAKIGRGEAVALRRDDLKAAEILANLPC